MNRTLLIMAFVTAAAATVFAFAAGATWAGILSTAAALLVIGALITRSER